MFPCDDPPLRKWQNRLLTVAKLGVTMGLEVRKAHTSNSKIEEAVEELSHSIDSVDANFCLYFASSSYDQAALAATMHAAFTAPVFGCSTSGEISAEGYSSNSIVGISFLSQRASVSPFLIENLSEITPQSIAETASSINKTVVRAKRAMPGANAVAIVLMDGLQKMEDRLLGMLSPLLPTVDVVGGSAGDDLKFKKTFIHFGGKAHTNAALVIVITTELPFSTFKIQHFNPTDRKLVITEADAANRTVLEINGEPAADAYAKAIGISVEELTPAVYSHRPLLISVGGESYIRAIQEISSDKSIKFFCAIEEGIVLSVGEGSSIKDNLRQRFDELRRQLRVPEVTLCFECVLRKLEVIDKNIQNEIGGIFRDAKAIGFHTYGEQLGAIHMSQTLTGIAFGKISENG